MLAPALPGTHLLYEAISAKLCTQVKDLTDAGKAALEAAFPGGEGADFRSKARLLKVVAKGENVASRSPSRRGSGKTKKASSRSRSKDKDAAGKKKASSRSGSRGRRDRDRGGKDRRSRSGKAKGKEKRSKSRSKWKSQRQREALQVSKRGA